MTQQVSFGRLLRELRLQAGLSQETLAELARMSAGGIGVLERGIRRAPQRQTLALLADALNLSPFDRERFEEAARRAGNGRRPRGQVRAIARHNLPYALTSFVGRDHAMRDLSNDVVNHRLITLTGTGGAGKTRLALETAHAVLDKFSDGVWFVELAPFADIGAVAQRVAETLGVTASDAVNDDWMDALAGKHQLLILDNCEHLLEACAELAQRLLTRSQHLHILATSRARLHVIGERVFHVTPLRDSAAVALFLDRAGISEPDDEERADVETICARLDGIPFAIELAAARVSAQSVKMVAANIGQRLSLLRHGSASVPRHKTMRALLDWSYDLLPESQRRVFQDLSIFSNGTTLENAVSVGAGNIAEREELLEVLSSLVDMSLVVVDFDVDDARYTMLETTREYAREKLVESGRLEEKAHRHAAAFLALAQHCEAKWRTSPNRQWHAQARSELENWRAAIRWTIAERHDVLLGQRLIAVLHVVWCAFALAEGLKWSRYALDLVDETTPRRVVADLLYTQAFLAFLAGDLTTALPDAERAQELYHALNDQRGIVNAKTITGRMLVEHGSHHEGESALSNALDIARDIGEPLLAATAHQGLGLSRGAAGDLDSARRHVAKALEIAKAQSAERVTTVAEMFAAEVHFRAGDKEAAIDLGKDALRDALLLGDEFAIMRAFSNLATFLIAADRYDEARDASRSALDFSHLAQGSTVVAWTLQHLAMVAAMTGGSARAARLFGFTQSRLLKQGARGDFSEQQERERLRAILESTISPSELETLTADGAAMRESEAIAEARAI